MKFRMMFAAALAAAAVTMNAEDDALVLHWPLNDGEGVTVKDAGPRKLDGRIMNPESSQWVAGREEGKALAFAGVNGKAPFVYVDGIAKDEFTRGMTIMCYFKPDPDKYIRKSVWYLVSNGKGARGFLFCIHYQRLLLGGDGNKLTAYAASNNSKTPLRGGEWHHLAATHDGDKTFKVYIDGVPAGVSSEKLTGAVTPGQGGIALGSQFGYGPAQGVFSDFKIYKRAFSDAEIIAAAQGE